MSRRRVDGWMEAVSDEEMEAADAFWEDWIGPSFSIRDHESGSGSPRTGSSAPSGSSAPTTGAAGPPSLARVCVSSTRIADFRANLTPTHAAPRPEICKLLVTQRGTALRGAPVVGPDGKPLDRGQGQGDEPGAGGITGRVNPLVPPLVEAMGTGFFVAPDRIVTAAHVVLDAVQVIVIPGKMGPGISVPGRPPVSSEPFGRFTVAPASIAIHPGAIAAATSPTAPVMAFFADDLAVIRAFPWRPRPPLPPFAFGGAYRLAGRPRPHVCVETTGYSAQTVDPNFQHWSRGFELPSTTPLVDFDLLAEKGASGSPIWQGPHPTSTGSAAAPRHVVGIVAMGNSPTHVGSPLLDAARIRWLMTA